MADRIAQAMMKLKRADRLRREAIEDLMRLREIRSRSLVADLGEVIAARYFGVDLEPPSNPGFDLVAPGGTRVQVRTLRDTPTNRRTSMGAMKEPYDHLLAIRLRESYEPEYAVDIPRAVMDELYPEGKRTSLTKTIEADNRVAHIDPDELLTPGAGATRYAREAQRQPQHLQRSVLS